MQTITVAKTFMLQLDAKRVGGTDENPILALPAKIVFVPGIHDVDDDVAEHWYTKLHLAGYVEPPPAPGMAEYHPAEIAALSPADQLALMPHPQDASTAPRAALPPLSAIRSVPRQPAPPPAEQ